MTYVKDINYLVKCLHYNYGVGDIKEIRRYADGRVEVDAQGYGMKTHTRTGRIVIGKTPGARTVKMYGHQITAIEIGG